jgi:hypothetical protein
MRAMFATVDKVLRDGHPSVGAYNQTI